MKRIITYLSITCILSSCNFSKNNNNTETQIRTTKKTRPSDFMLMQRMYPNNQLNTTSYKKAVAWKNAKKSANFSQARVWELVGPLNIGGRITDIEIPDDSADTYYVGTASGGIFKTTDAGGTWTPIFDDQEFLSIGDMAISKRNPKTIWVGTGEPNMGGGSMTYDGNGIFKSEDGGLTWKNKGLKNVGGFGKLLISPTNDNTIFAGAAGPVFKTDKNRGVYRTKDGGKTWKQVFFVSEKTSVIDMAIHPTDGNIIYAATWERQRTPLKTIFGGATSGIHRSKDGGESWEELTKGLPSGADKGRISIAISESNPNVLYTRYTNASGAISGVYRTSDGGDSWTKKNHSQLKNVGFHWWFNGISVDPTNENTIYNVDFNVHKSTNGGDSWSQTFSGVHVDQHAIAFNKKKPKQVLLGNDGGVYYSNNGGDSPKKYKNLPITQFYRINVDPQNNKKVFGGAQDNSVMRTTTGSKSDWKIVTGGDGFQPLIDPNNSNIVFALSQEGNLQKSTNGGSSFSSSMSGISQRDRKNWDTPITFDPNNTKTIYYGANRLYKSTNSGGNWTAISEDHTKGKTNNRSNYATIFSIDVSPLNSKVIYTGTDDGNVWVTKDGGSSWTKISEKLPNRWVTKVLADPADAASVYVTYSGYAFGEFKGHVYKSSNYGETWTDIGETLPDIPVNDILKDKNNILYLGTDIGVLGSPNDGKNWIVLGDNLPSVRVPDLFIHEKTNYLYAGTYGRSIYKIDISEGILNSNNIAEIEQNIKLFPNPATNHINILFKNNTPKTIVLYDALGRQVVNTIKTEKQQVKIPVSKLSSGSYFVKLQDNKKSITKKISIK